MRRQPLSGEREKRAGRNTVTEDRLCRTARATETIGISTTFVTGFQSIGSDVMSSFAYPVAFYESVFCVLCWSACQDTFAIFYDADMRFGYECLAELLHATVAKHPFTFEVA